MFARNHCWKETTTVRSLCIVDVHMSLSIMSNTEKTFPWKNSSIWRLYLRYTYVAANNMKYTEGSLQIVRCFCPTLTEFGFFRRSLLKFPSTKFHGIPSSGGLGEVYGQTDGRTDMAKLIGVFTTIGTHLKSIISCGRFCMCVCNRSLL